jgi:signal peptidase I
MLVLWLVLRAFVFESFSVPSPSMAPTLKPGDRVLVSKLSYHLHDVRRGDIVVFHRPPEIQADPNVKNLVKRVIALPGETLELRDGRLLINGHPLIEPYLPRSVVTDGLKTQKLPPGRYWVMGDNRGDSADSRVFGSIPRSLIVGRAFLHVWPPSSVGLL